MTDSTMRRQHCLEAVKAARQLAQAAYDRGERVDAVLVAYSTAIDALMQYLLGASEPPKGAFCVVATGGYGRQELFPYSDLDVMVLHHNLKDEQLQGWVEQWIYPLWDAKLAVGHAVRRMEDTIVAASSDLTLHTSLLDLRFVGGNRGVFDDFVAQVRRKLFSAAQLDAFIEQLLQERHSRHERFGDSIYLLEPNVKSGQGGLRDLNMAVWAAKAKYGDSASPVHDLAQLVTAQAATPRQMKALLSAKEFLSQLRFLMQMQCRRAQDQLTFELQEQLGPVLYPDAPIPGGQRRVASVAPAVERLMRAYYRHARHVVLEGEGVLLRCRNGNAAYPTSVDAQRFWETPAELICVFERALQEGTEIDRPTMDLIAEAASGEPGVQLYADEIAAASFVRVLAHTESGHRQTILQQMHDAGVLNAIIPEFEPCTGRVQHDVYHVYTVDQHTLYVVGFIKGLLRGEVAESHQGLIEPQLLAVSKQTQKPEVLVLAALLHDVAKPLGSEHAKKGARLALGITGRLGLSASEQQDVAFLVHEHLTMAHMSQRRDLNDLSVIESFAKIVVTIDRLRWLYLLTIADTAMTSPQNLTPWKASLLEELYLKTYQYLQHGGAMALQQQQELATQQRRLQDELQKRWGDAGGQIVARLPADLVSSQKLDDLLHYVSIALEFERAMHRPARIGVRQHTEHTVELTVCSADAPRLLSDIAGVLTSQRIEVLGAQVYTLLQSTDASRPPTVLDIFIVRPPSQSDPTLWSRFYDALVDVLSGKQSIDALIGKYHVKSKLPTRVMPQVPVRVSINNDVSDRFTIVELQAPDCPGLLHAVTRCLSELNLDIAVSKVATEAGRVIDVFYVRETTSGAKVTAQTRIDQIHHALTQSIHKLRS